MTKSIPAKDAFTLAAIAYTDAQSSNVSVQLESDSAREIAKALRGENKTDQTAQETAKYIKLWAKQKK